MLLCRSQVRTLHGIINTIDVYFTPYSNLCAKSNLYSVPIGPPESDTVAGMAALKVIKYIIRCR